MEEVRVTISFHYLPFVISVSGNKASLRLECSLKGWFLGYGFGSCINGESTRIYRIGRRETSPLCFCPRNGLVIRMKDRMGLPGRAVVARMDFFVGRWGVLAKAFDLRIGPCVSTAHMFIYQKLPLK